MSLIKLILLLVYKFVNLDESEYSKLKEELELDWAGVPMDENSPELKKGKWDLKLKHKIKVFTAGPWARLGIAVAYIPMVRWISDWMNPRKHKDDEEED